MRLLHRLKLGELIWIRLKTGDVGDPLSDQRGVVIFALNHRADITDLNRGNWNFKDLPRLRLRRRGWLKERAEIGHAAVIVAPPGLTDGANDVGVAMGFKMEFTFKAF